MMPRQTQARAGPVTEEQRARARVLLWEQALEATGGDYSKIKYRQSKWARTLPLGNGSQSTPNTGPVRAGGFHGTTSIQYDITAHNTDLLSEIALQCSDSEFVLFHDVEHVFRKAFPATSTSTGTDTRGTTGTIERHCWAAAYFPETDTHPKTLIHWDARAATRKQEWDSNYGDKPYRRTIMSAGHKHLGDLLKPVRELYGGPDNGAVSNEQASSIRWIRSVVTGPTADRAFEIAMDLVHPLCR